MTNEKDEIEILTRQIIKEIDDKPENTIKIFESILLGDQQNTLSFDEYLQQLQKTQKKCTCQSSWTHSQLVINCLDCQKTKNACICVKCFLKGNHQGHRISISHPDSASCDCGNPNFWSPSGFCSDHPGQDPHPDQTQLTKDTRVKIMSISNAIFSKYPTLIANKQFLFCKVTDFLTKIVSIGDATQRCVVLSFQNAFTVYDLFDRCYSLKEIATKKFIELLGSLVNDQVFRRFYSLSILNDLPKFTKIVHTKASDFQPNSSFVKIFQFTFHGVTLPITKELIQNSLFEWKTVFIESFKIQYNECFRNVSSDYMKRSMPGHVMDRLMTILKAALSSIEKERPKFVELVNEIASYLIQYEFSCPFSRVFGDKYDDPKQVQSAQYINYHFLFKIVYKLASYGIYTTKPLQLLKDFFDLSVGYFFKIDKLNNNGGFDRDFHLLSVLDEKVNLAQSFPIHVLAYKCLNLKEKKSLIEYVSEVTDDVDAFLKNWSIIPLRWLAALYLNDFGFFVRNSDDAIGCLKSFIYHKNKKYKFAPTFALLQALTKSAKKVDDFLMMIISTFGFFNVETNANKSSSEKLDDNEERLILFTILHFILCLVFDTFCGERNSFMMRKLCVISELMKSDLNIDEINSIWPLNTADDDRFFNDLKSYASRIKTKNGSKFHLTDNSEWHPFLPFINTQSIIPLIQKFIHDNPDSLINFPKIPKDSEKILLSPTLWAFQYYILRKKCCRDYPIINQLVFNTLIITSQLNQENIDDKGDDETPIQVKDFTDLANQLKKFTFSQFLRKKVVFFNSNKVKKSMIELVASFGKIGLTVLTRMNVSTEVKISNPMKEELAKKNHERAKMLKMKIMNNFSKKQKKFQSTSISKINEDEQEEEEEKSDEKNIEMECSICHLENKESDFVYPALVYKSPLNSYINWRFRNAKLINENDFENQENDEENFSDLPSSFETVNVVRICLHPIHAGCKKNVFSCPTDRCPRNSSIPIISEIYENVDELKQSVFVLALEFIEKTYNNDLKIAVHSLASQIEILEIRHRSNPNCLDDSTIQPTLRNIYLCIWHTKRNDVKKVLSNKSNANMSPLMKYILHSLQFNETQVEKDKIDMENFLNKTAIENDYKLYQFMRCAAIFDHFARCSKIIDKVDNKIIDWDEILGSTYLCDHYKVNHLLNRFVSDKDVELSLPMFSFINLPKNYLDFIHPPFNAPILEYNDDCTILCLFTGRKFLLKNSMNIDLKNFMDNQFNGSFDIFLKLNGKNASQLVLFNKEINARMDIQSFYVDRFGDQDLGMKRGSLLYLNESNEEETIDMILSGLWTNYSSSWKVANL